LTHPLHPFSHSQARRLSAHPNEKSMGKLFPFLVDFVLPPDEYHQVVGGHDVSARRRDQQVRPLSRKMAVNIRQFHNISEVPTMRSTTYNESQYLFAVQNVLAS
jgi:hypothetical protein